MLTSKELIMLLRICHLQQCTDHALLTDSELSYAKQAMFYYIHSIAVALEQRYSEKAFVLQNCAFLEVSRRKF